MTQIPKSLEALRQEIAKAQQREAELFPLRLFIRTNWEKRNRMNWSRTAKELISLIQRYSDIDPTLADLVEAMTLEGYQVKSIGVNTFFDVTTNADRSGK